MLFLHGGPGAGTSPVFQKYFNPNKYRLIMFDQRGCGKSTPYGEVADNTTQGSYSRYKFDTWVF
jgi:proline iminopeptidase